MSGMSTPVKRLCRAASPSVVSLKWRYIGTFSASLLLQISEIGQFSLCAPSQARDHPVVLRSLTVNKHGSSTTAGSLAGCSELRVFQSGTYLKNLSTEDGTLGV